MKGIRGWVLGLIKIVILLFIFLYPIPYTLYPVHALENDIGFSKISPASPLYFLKTIRENLELKMALTPHVVMIRELEFATRRLREAKTLIWQNQDLIPPTLEKYALHLKNLPDKDLKDKEVLTGIKENLNIHLQVLRQEMYYQVSNLRAKMAIRATMNKIIQRVDISSVVKAPTCDFFFKEATMSAANLNQTEKAVLLDRASKCLGLLP